MESPIFYNDGISKVGVFFQDAHRQYLPFPRIPKNFVQAIVAAEDRKFFSHFGIDIVGISRAMLANLKAGKIVQGGSTITQQAAKNLFKRKNRSISEKLKELLFALRLEYHYSKEKILEFYANQFYVSGNGHGLGVAAKYYFDKEAPDLSLLESAFIAGSVKRPNYYNPFIKRDEASSKAARERARSRTRYVLNKMRDWSMVSEEEYQQNIDKEIPFRKGRMSYALNTIMDLVKEAIAEQEIEEALVSHGIDNVGISGIRVITSVDKDLQEYSLTELRKELSRVSIRLQGYDHRALQEQYKKLSQKSLRSKNSKVLFGKILSVSAKNEVEIKVSLGTTRVSGRPSEMVGFIDQQGLQGMLSALAKYNKHRWTEAGPDDLHVLVKDLEVGDLVYVSMRGLEKTTGNILLDLEKYPGVQGGGIAIKEGAIKAMLGGNENRFFNRAVDARRLMGSVSKLLLYTAAIQLGWNSADILKNERDAFVYQNQVYFPRPDHISPYQWVSMNWAGVKSENVASVWLLSHLTDRLSPGHFKEVLAGLGLAKREDESYQQYRSRIRDKHGIVINSKAIRKLAFEIAVENIGPDLLFDGKMEEYEFLSRLHYLLDASVEIENNPKEAALRQTILRRSFVKLQKMNRQLVFYKRQVEDELDSLGQYEFFPDQEGEDLPGHLYYNMEEGYVFSGVIPGSDWRLINIDEAARHWQIDQAGGGNFWQEIKLDGVLSVETFSLLSKQISTEYKRLAALPPYGTNILFQVRDFRVMVGLQYLIGLCRQMGINSELDAVLSFPLGSNVITLLEVARTYETMVTGMSYRSGRDEADVSLMIIDRIENSEGEVIYRPKRTSKRIIDEKTSLAVSNIMRNVVRYGTGRYAARNIRLHSQDVQREVVLTELDLQVPTLGKTGTANNFRNSSFAGYIPGLSSKMNAMALEKGYALAVYEGYDDNIPMVRSTTHITGSTGALRLWTKMADYIINDNQYADQMDLDDLSFSSELEVPMFYPQIGQTEISNGGDKSFAISDNDSFYLAPASDHESVKLGTKVITFGKIVSEQEFLPQRYLKPFWGVH